MQYEKVETAVATRARLHGLKWPSTNSKFLAVDYLTPEEASRISEGQLEVKPFLEGGASEAGEAGEVVKMETADTKQQGITCILYVSYNGYFSPGEIFTACFRW